jgi:hypothetical protein
VRHVAGAMVASRTIWPSVATTIDATAYSLMCRARCRARQVSVSLGEGRHDDCELSMCWRRTSCTSLTRRVDAAGPSDASGACVPALKRTMTSFKAD